MSAGAYAADKALHHRQHLEDLRGGKMVYPLHLHLIISDLCNLNCPNCAYRLEGYPSNQHFSGPKGERNPQRFLSLDTVKAVLDDCAAMGTHAVEFTGGGEPLVHRQAREILTYAQELGLDTALITNGVLLDRVIDRAVRCQWVRVSIDAANHEVFSQVRPSFGMTTPFYRVINNLRKLRLARDAFSGPGCVIGAGFVVQKENWHQLVEAANLFSICGADNIRISGLFTPMGDRYFSGWREQAVAAEKEAKRLFDGIEGFRVYGRLEEKLADLEAPPDYARCWYQHLTTYLGADGNLYRCCVTSYNDHGLLGNIHEAGGLKALWERPETQVKLREFDARSCSRCQFNDRNRAIEAALSSSPLPPAPESVVHPFFV